jgi:hypothetical protein
MDAINRAAREAVASDLNENAGLFYSKVMLSCCMYGGILFDLIEDNTDLFHCLFSQNQYQQYPHPPPPPPPTGGNTGDTSSWSTRQQGDYSSSSSSDPVAPSTDKAISENLRGDDK